MIPGDRIYISQVPYKHRSEFDRHCTRLTVEHTTPKAVLVRAGESTQWFPRSILTRATNASDIYIIPRSFQLSPTWRARCGRSPGKRREKTPQHHADSST